MKTRFYIKNLLVFIILFLASLSFAQETNCWNALDDDADGLVDCADLDCANYGQISGDLDICFGESTTLTAAFGKLYTWNTGATNQSINVNSNGIYAVTITAGNGCNYTSSVEVNYSNQFSITGFNGYKDSERCAPSCNGYISLRIKGILSPSITSATIEINGITTNVDASIVSAGELQLTGLCEGTYDNLTIVDGAGCTINYTFPASVSISEPVPSPATIDGNLNVCSPACTKIKASESVLYAWSTGATTQAIDACTSGVYTVTTTDVNGCTSSSQVTVTVNTATAGFLPGSDPEVCVGETLSVLWSIPASSYIWSTGGTGQGINNLTPGVYTVTITDANGCTASASEEVILIACPENCTDGLDNDLDGLVDCADSDCTPVDYSTFSTNPTCAGADGTIGVGTTCVKCSPFTFVLGTETIIGSGTFVNLSGGTYTINITDSQTGCTTSETFVLTDLSVPTVSISGDTEICNGSNSTLTASGNNINTYSWSTGATGSSINVSNAGTYTVTATSADNCTSSSQVTVSVGTGFTASVDPSVVWGCVGETVTVTAYPGGAGYSYLWSSTLSTNQTQSITIGAVNYRQVTVTDSYGCSSVAGVSMFTPNNISSIVGNYNGVNVSSPATISCGDCITLNATYTKSLYERLGMSENANKDELALLYDPSPTYTWSNGGNTGSIVVCPNESTTYSVTVSTSGGCSKVLSFTVNVTGTLTATIDADKNQVCSGQTTTLTASGGTSYQWSTSETTESIEVGAGIYTVTVSDANGCTSSASYEILSRPDDDFWIIYRDPVNGPTLGSEFNLCVGDTPPLMQYGGINNPPAPNDRMGANAGNSARFDCTDEISRWEWSINGGPWEVVDPSLPPRAPTTIPTDVAQQICYRYFIDVSNSPEEYCVFCDDYSNVICVNILAPAVSIASGDLEICIGDNTTLTASGGTSYQWSTTETTANISVGAGTYTVTATDANGCTSSTSISVTQSSNPTATISGDLEICIGTTTVLTASGGGSYLWSNGQTNSTTTVFSGTYTVTVTNTEGCSSVSSVEVISTPVPAVVISGDQTICTGTTTEIEVTGGGVPSTFLWSTGSTASTLQLGVGTYTVTVTAIDGGCTQSDTWVITELPNPIVSISGNTSFCAGGSTILTASGGGTYSWSGGGTSSTKTVTTAGTYTVTVTSAAGCTSTSSVIVTQNTSPDGDIIGETSYCQGEDPIVLTADFPTAVSYLWTTGETSSSITASPSALTIYYVTVTDANGCTARDAHTIYVGSVAPYTLTGNPEPVCEGENLTLTLNGGPIPNTIISWSTGETNVSSINVLASQSMTVSVTVTQLTSYPSKGSPIVVTCSEVYDYTPVVNALPVATISGNETICNNNPINLTASGGSSYLWSTGDISSSISVSSQAVYTVTVTDANGCTSTSSVDVIEDFSPDLNSCPLDDLIITPCDNQAAAIKLWHSEIVLAIEACVGTKPSYVSNPSPIGTLGCGDIATYTFTVTNDCGTSSTTLSIIYQDNEAPDVSTCSLTPLVNPTNQSQINNWIAASKESLAACTNSDCSDINIISPAVNFPTGCVPPNQVIDVDFIVEDDCGNQSTVSTTVSFAASTFPTATISGDLEICIGTTTVLTASGGGSYLWSNGQTNSTIIVFSGTYTVTVTNTEGCSSVSSVEVISTPVPAVVISGDQTICTGTTTEIEVTGGGVPSTFLWSTGSTASTLQLGVGTYTVTVTAIDGGCTQSDTWVITELPNPTATISGNLNICVGETAVLTASGGSTAIWNTGLVGDKLFTTNAGFYTVTVTDANACTSSSSVEVVLCDLCDVDIQVPTQVCKGTEATVVCSLGAGITVDTYNWTIVSGGSIVGANTNNSATILFSGSTVEICLTVDNANCEPQQVCKTINTDDVPATPGVINRQ